MSIYVDIIFLENLFMNYIILFATGIILKTKVKLLNYAISSVVGSIYAVMTYISTMPIYSNIIIKIILSISMTYIAFTPRTITNFIKHIMIFYLTSFTFGGVAFALIYFVKPQNILLEKGVLIGTYPIKLIVAGGIIGFIIIVTAFKTIKNRLSKKDIICEIKIKIDNKEEEIRGIVDTGNFLRDPISKAPVIVVEKKELYNVIPSYILNNVSEIINGKSVELAEYIARIKLIPFTSLGRNNGLLLGIKADETIIYFEEHHIIVKNLIIGIYDGILNKANKYHALVGMELLENNGGIENDYFTTVKI